MEIIKRSLVYTSENNAYRICILYTKMHEINWTYYLQDPEKVLIYFLMFLCVF